jgi:two-component system, cell cycle sensor histidine kinase and response regulator CckA
MTDADSRLQEPLAKGLDWFQALRDLSEALAHAVSDDALFRKALELLSSVLELSAAAVLIQDPELRMRFQSGSGLSAAFRESWSNGWPWPPAATNPQPLSADDLSEVPELKPCREALTAEGILSLAFVPLLDQGCAQGGLLLCRRIRRRFTTEETRFAASMANLVGAAAARLRQAKTTIGDPSDIRRSVGTLRASEELFTRIFHMSPDAIDLTRLEDGVSLDCNGSYVKLYGYSREEIIGHSTLPGDLGVWVRKEDRARHIAELRERGEVFGFETPARRKDGSTFIALLSSSMLEIDGQLCNLTLTRDITERKNAEEALRLSEEKFSKTFRLSPDSININRLKDGVYLDINQGFTAITGYTAEEVIGRSSLPGDVSTWVHAEDRDRLVAALESRGEVTGLEAQFRRKDGSVLTGMMSARLIELRGERCVLSITRDITERKQAEEALRESTQRLQLALASGNLGIWDRNLLDDTEIWDDSMYGLYGIERGALPPDYKTWIERIVHPDDVAWINATVRAALAGKRPYDLKFRIVRPDGVVRHIKSNGIVIRDSEGSPVRVIGINRDRTEQVEAEAERRRLQAEVHHAEKLESIGSLAGGVAHDMNNVLTAILVTAEILRGKCAEDDPGARPLDTILHAGQRGRDLVKALTDFARKGLEEASAVDLNEVLRKEVELLRQTTLKKIQVVLELDESLPEIHGAASELGSALMNLSVNAVDAMPNGGTLTFRSRTLGDGWIELAVADTGHGMTSEVQAKAMEPFFTTKPLGKGTGLGLSRVYGTVRAHGGIVEIHSQAGAGTTILLRLPTSPGSLAGVTPSDDAVQEGGDSVLKVLLVDDEGIILDTITAMLEVMGHTVETASLGEEALRRLEVHQDFDLVILDHNMPGITGVETLLQLRGKYRDLPVILSTGFLDPKTEDLLAGIPEVSLLKKPYNRRELHQALAGFKHRPAQNGSAN